MNYKILFLILTALAIKVSANGQSNIETVLTSVEKNNKSLVANRQFWEAQKLVLSKIQWLCVRYTNYAD